ncbi:MAG: hypothetical protein DMG61_23595 [Acidobacteria bacterium]|nr:MAG: hypothetical protein DMG61_23595 [Acidobacteriota bacterium]
MRRIQGVLSLAKKHGIAAVDDACAAALEVGVHEYRFVRRYLDANSRCIAMSAIVELNLNPIWRMIPNESY